MQTSSEIAHLTTYAQRRQMQQLHRRPLSHADFGDDASQYITAAGSVLPGVAQIIAAATGNQPTTVAVLPSTGGYATQPYAAQPYYNPAAAAAAAQQSNNMLLYLGLGVVAVGAFMLMGQKKSA